VRLPLLLLIVPCGLTGALIYHEVGWAWAVAFAVTWTGVFLLIEWIVDTMVRELRKVRLRG
jgi:prepilin signal peptidase PulO-like enzyme (type II secretory pathway)